MVTDEIIKLRKEAEEWAKNNPGVGLLGPFISRSCWNCNGAHEYLKHVDYPIECFECGNIYFRGIKLTEDEEVK